MDCGMLQALLCIREIQDITENFKFHSSYKSLDRIYFKVVKEDCRLDKETYISCMKVPEIEMLIGRQGLKDKIPRVQMEVYKMICRYGKKEARNEYVKLSRNNKSIRYQYRYCMSIIDKMDENGISIDKYSEIDASYLKEYLPRILT